MTPPSPAGQRLTPATPAEPGQEAAGVLAETVAKMTLEVLVYSEGEAQRMVFINGRKYVEGQTVEGELVLERITREGAVLGYQGQRALLRPKLNPYVRP